MAQTNNTTATPNNEVVNPQTENAKKRAPKTRRVFETQGDWARLEAQTLTLLATLAKGITLSEAEQKAALKGFAFGTTTDKDGKDTQCPTKSKDAEGNVVSLTVMDTQPHAKNYVLCLALGFASPKATKFLKGTCLEGIDRTEIAKTICGIVYPKGNVAKRLFGTPEVTPKRGKWVAEQVLAAVNA